MLSKTVHLELSNQNLRALLLTEDITNASVMHAIKHTTTFDLVNKYNEFFFKVPKSGLIGNNFELVPIYAYKNILFYVTIGNIFSILTVFIFCICAYLLRNSTEQITMLLLISVEYLLLKAFGSYNLMYFYVYFESLLIPMFILILRKGGGPRKTISAQYMFGYTTIFSSPMLYVLMLVKNDYGSLNIFELHNSLNNANSLTAHLL